MNQDRIRVDRITRPYIVHSAPLIEKRASIVRISILRSHHLKNESSIYIAGKNKIGLKMVLYIFFNDDRVVCFIFLKV